MKHTRYDLCYIAFIRPVLIYKYNGLRENITGIVLTKIHAFITKSFLTELQVVCRMKMFLIQSFSLYKWSFDLSPHHPRLFALYSYSVTPTNIMS